MSRQRRRSSTRTDPFGQFRELGLNLSIDEGLIEGLGFTSEPLNVFEVDWVGFLGGSELNNPDLLHALRIQLDDARPSAISALVSMTANIARFIRDIDAAPMPGEIVQQLSDLCAALRQAGSLAQGRKREEPIAAQPKGQAKASAHAQQDTVSNALPVGRRSRILHPILQDHIVLAMQRGRDKIVNDFELQAFDAHVEKREKQLCEFFDALPELLDWLEDAASFSKELEPVLKRDRKRGAPSNRAGDWAMIRLMWIWRDVLGHDINIYVRRISGRTELREPEPNPCVSFIQRIMERIDPHLMPKGAGNLESKLIALRPSVPTSPLVVGSSRNK